MSSVADTARLRLRRMEHGDAAFVVRLLNTPGFLTHIGDRGVRTTEQAIGWLDAGPLASYAEHGYGLYLVERRDNGLPIGICGPLRRAGLPAPDLGFALLPEHCGQGYAVEAGQAVVELARGPLAIARLLAIVAPGNTASVATLRRLGFGADGQVQLAADAERLDLFRLDLSAG